MKLLSDIDVSGKRVFLRADVDVNVEGLESRVESLENDVRLRNLKPTIDYLISHNAKQIIIAGHIGRPESRRNQMNQKVGEIGDSEESENRSVGGPDFYDEKLSTKHLVPTLEKLLGQKIEFSPDVILRPKVEESQQRSFAGAQDDNKKDTQDDKIGVEPLIVLLENLRFWDGEEKNDPGFAKQLASMADVYINEAFGVSHRIHASIVGVPALLPDVEDPDGIHSRRAAGLHLQKEVETLSKLINNPQRPMVAIIGGAKIETKISVIESLVKVTDFVLVGGKLIHQIGDLASQGLALRSYEVKVIVAKSTPDGKDIDDESIEKFREIIKGAKTVVWNGPMGYFEGGFERGTLAIAQSIIESGAYSVIGGGETTEFLGSKNLLSKFSFVSSGGGAMLEFLSGKKLLGITALS